MCTRVKFSPIVCCAGVVFSKLSERVDLFRSRIPPATGGKAPANAGPILRLLNASKDQYVVTKAAKAAAVLLRCVQTRAAARFYCDILLISFHLPLPRSFDPANPDLAGKLVNWIRQVLRSRDAYDSATGVFCAHARGYEWRPHSYSASACL